MRLVLTSLDLGSYWRRGLEDVSEVLEVTVLVVAVV